MTSMVTADLRASMSFVVKRRNLSSVPHRPVFQVNVSLKTAQDEMRNIMETCSCHKDNLLTNGLHWYCPPLKKRRSLFPETDISIMLLSSIINPKGLIKVPVVHNLRERTLNGKKHRKASMRPISPDAFYTTFGVEKTVKIFWKSAYIEFNSVVQRVFTVLTGIEDIVYLMTSEMGVSDAKAFAIFVLSTKREMSIYISGGKQAYLHSETIEHKTERLVILKVDATPVEVHEIQV
ncbi:hypothetical protein EDD18DRAFT_1328726 [Armillaria luteobubalina]|uniref:Uncharacterized protein n=1 Tax=Armillaria luteobubalina TaxID=153913 RepID=A0AA39UXG6_9AGAR|nr:hypothetical protein EDD18DRAFT_1328726 [Armillaria luteobubalina]